MNLPAYSLYDAPVSNVLSVCLGTLPYSAPSPSVASAQAAPLAPRPQRTDVKGKGKAKAEEVDEVDDDESDSGPEEWEDAEYWGSMRRSMAASRRSVRGGSKAGEGPRAEGQKEQTATEEQGGWDRVFATATKEGWAVYSMNPLRVLHQKASKKASLRLAIPLQLTNILLLVGGPPTPMYPPNHLVFYDVSLSAEVEVLRFESPVLHVAARRDRLVVVLARRVALFVLGEGPDAVWQEGAWETCENKRGLACVATDVGATLLVLPGRQPGQVQVVHLPPFDPSVPAPTRPPSSRRDPNAPPYPSKAVIVAHKTPLSALALTSSGTLIATASEAGTLVRLWDPRTGSQTRELRRGADGAEIWGIRLRRDGAAVAVSSDKGTVHVWDLGEAREKEKERRKEEDNSRPVSLSILKPYLPKYFHSQWSDAHFRLPPPAPAPPRSLPLPQLFPDPSAPRNPPREQRKVPTIEDDVCLVAWIEGEAAPPPPDPMAKAPRRRREKVKDRPAPKLEPQVVAITRSGGWYRLAIPDLNNAPSSASSVTGSKESSRPSSPALGPRQRKSSSLGGLAQEKSVEMVCLEYRRFGEVEVWDEEREVEAMMNAPVGSDDNEGRQGRGEGGDGGDGEENEGEESDPYGSSFSSSSGFGTDLDVADP